MLRNKGYLLEKPVLTNHQFKTMLVSIAQFKVNLKYIKLKNYKEFFKNITTLEEIQAELQLFFHAKSFPTNIFWSQVIKKLGQLGEIELVMQIYEIILKKELHEPVIFNCTINALSHQSECKRALSIFETAKKMGKTNAITYNSIINVIATSHQPNKELAIHILHEAIEQKAVDAATFNTTLNVLSTTPETNIERSLSLFNLAKKLECVDHITYKRLLDIIALNDKNNSSLAYPILDEIIHCGHIPNLTDKARVDLHGLNYGSVYYWLKREIQNIIQKINSPISILFVFGGGTHKKNNDTHTVQQALLDLMTEFKGNPSISEEDLLIGTYTITFQPTIANKLETKSTPSHYSVKKDEETHQSSINYPGRMFSAPQIIPVNADKDHSNKKIKQKCPTCVFL